jgi:hypothetical protein
MPSSDGAPVSAMVEAACLVPSGSRTDAAQKIGLGNGIAADNSAREVPDITMHPHEAI